MAHYDGVGSVQRLASHSNGATSAFTACLLQHFGKSIHRWWVSDRQRAGSTAQVTVLGLLTSTQAFLQKLRLDATLFGQTVNTRTMDSLAFIV